MTKHDCLESINSLYVEKTAKGYNMKPCCLWKRTGSHGLGFTDKIEDLIDHPVLNEVRTRFIPTETSNWKRDECDTCVMKENTGGISKRLRSLERGYNGTIQRWDIRPGHTCNLKCIMCNPNNSSKWYEDLDIYESYNGTTLNLEQQRIREQLDWDYIVDKCKNNAKEIYIAGGEPFYMKSINDFLDRLSQFEWNRKNTRLTIQTNAMSNSEKLLNILKKFQRLNFNISIDGWGSVNELIRFPTVHEEMLKNVSQLQKLQPWMIWNMTVQALNLPNIDKTIEKIGETWKPINPHYYDLNKLWSPRHLSINSLKPSVVARVNAMTKLKKIKEFCKDYKYDAKQNVTMQKFLLELDEKRGTNSPKTIPWCFV
tara:strand:- start:24267 stop:25376 length:1110 start_codon:yes stop_codon:yes gene_type:complete